MTIRLFDGVQPIGFQEERAALVKAYHRDIAPIYQAFSGEDGKFKDAYYDDFLAVIQPALLSLEKEIGAFKEKYGLTA